MYILFFLVFLGLGISMCFVEFNISPRINKVLNSLKLVFLFIAAFIFFSSFTMESEIKERDMILISEETMTYELVSLRTDKEIVGHGSKYYLHIYENRVFDFYYKSTKNGMEGFEPGTIIADDVFIVPTIECSPVIVETIRTYDYSFTPFERFWFSQTTTLEPITHTSYDIYVPEDSILGSYELE